MSARSVPLQQCQGLRGLWWRDTTRQGFLLCPREGRHRLRSGPCASARGRVLPAAFSRWIGGPRPERWRTTAQRSACVAAEGMRRVAVSGTMIMNTKGIHAAASSRETSASQSASASASGGHPEHSGRKEAHRWAAYQSVPRGPEASEGRASRYRPENEGRGIVA